MSFRTFNCIGDVKVWVSQAHAWANLSSFKLLPESTAGSFFAACLVAHQAVILLWHSECCKDAVYVEMGTVSDKHSQPAIGSRSWNTPGLPQT